MSSLRDETRSLGSDSSAGEDMETDRDTVRCDCKGKCARARRNDRGCACKVLAASVFVVARLQSAETEKELKAYGDPSSGSHRETLERTGPPRERLPTAEDIEEFVDGLSPEQIRRSFQGLLRHSRGTLHLARLYADVEPAAESGDHPFAAPPNPELPEWCVCGRCRDMGRGRERENICCGHRHCVTTEEYFLSTSLDHNVLTLTIRLHADFMCDEPNYQPNGFRKAAYRQYILGQYGYLGRGHRRIAPSCVVTCIRTWFPSPDGYYMGYRSD